MTSPLALIGVGGVAMAALVWKSVRSFSGGGRRSGPDNNWMNENYMAVQDSPQSELRPHDTSPSGYPGESGG